MSSEPKSSEHWWRKYDIPWFAWPFVAVAVVASAVLLFVAAIIGMIVDPTAGWARFAAVGLVATVVLPFTGHWWWALGALIVTIVTGALWIRPELQDE